MPNLPNRRSIRLKAYDYSQEGLYFLTLCCQDRICRFGKVVNGKMILNERGKIAEVCWLQIPEHFPNVILHEYVIMPNHIHGIIEIAQAKNCQPDQTVGAKNFSPVNDNEIKDFSPINQTNNLERAKDFSPQPETAKDISSGNNWKEDNSSENIRAKDFSPQRNPVIKGTSKTVGSIVRGFKIGVTKWVRQNTDIHHLWRRDYYEHVIRNDSAYDKISTYIQNNPLNWGKDKFYN